MNKLMVILSLILVMVSCKKDDVKAKEEIEAAVVSGSWVISSFVDSGTDETANFNGFSFTFSDGGVLTASNGSTSYSGTWSVTDSNSGDDSPSDLDFNILFSLGNNFDDLSDDWDIESHEDNLLKLYDVSGGNGGTDYLTFVKN